MKSANAAVLVGLLLVACWTAQSSGQLLVSVAVSAPCIITCPTALVPVCGSNGVTYANQCQFARIQCLASVSVSVGQCGVQVTILGLGVCASVNGLITPIAGLVLTGLQVVNGVVCLADGVTSLLIGGTIDTVTGVVTGLLATVVVIASGEIVGVVGVSFTVVSAVLASLVPVLALVGAITATVAALLGGLIGSVAGILVIPLALVGTIPGK